MKVQKVYLLQQSWGDPTQCLLRHSQPIKIAKGKITGVPSLEDLGRDFIIHSAHAYRATSDPESRDFSVVPVDMK